MCITSRRTLASARCNVRVWRGGGKIGGEVGLARPEEQLHHARVPLGGGGVQGGGLSDAGACH
eukprot:6242357-Pyramimonas_sp.AAC.1